MERAHEEMRSLGLLGIYKEACLLISSWKKVFNQIYLALVCPFAFNFLVHADVSDFIFRKMIHDLEKILITHQHTPQHVLLLDLIILLILMLVSFIYFTIFSLVSTSAVACTIASIYAGREPTFKNAMGVFLEVWKRLLVTLMCANATLFIYTLLIVGAPFSILGTLNIGLGNHGFAIFFIIAIIYLAGIMCLSIIWNLAYVMSVLEEDFHGFQAMIKCMKLIRGKLGLAIFECLKFNFLIALVRIMFIKFVVHRRSLGSVEKLTYWILFILVLSMLFLFQVVVQTVIYFVCESNHHLNIDNLTLSEDHLELCVDEQYHMV